MTTYLPEASCFKRGEFYIATYRYADNQQWRQIWNSAHKRPVLFPSASEAVNAAKEHMRKALNPEIRTERDEPEEEADLLGVADWRRGKQEERAQAQIVRNTKGKLVKVEKRTKKGKRG